MLARYEGEAGFAVLRAQSYSTFGPLLAAISWQCPRFVDRLRREDDLPFGDLLAAAVRDPPPLTREL